MRELVQKISADGCSRLGAALHLGAGACREIDEYLRLKAKKVMLVEANPELAGSLRSRNRAMARVEVLSAAVAAEEGEAVLRVLNDPRESSLYRPAALLKHCPNLSESREVAVPAVTLSGLVGRLSPDASLDNLLLLELQGAELSVLSSASPKALQKFCWIAVRASAEALYEGGARLADVDALLQQSGFRPAPLAQDEAAWPFRNVLYSRDAQLVRMRTLDDLLHEHERTIQAQRKVLEERTRRITILEGENASLEQRAGLLEGESAKMRRAQEEQMRLARSESEKLLRAQEEQVRLEKNEAASRQELVEARRAAALSTKLQTLREADLRDLQQRYRQSRSIQEQQRSLLVKLAERLRAASSHFRQLADSEAVLLPGDGAKPRLMGGAKGRQARPRSSRRSGRARGRKS